MASCCAVPACRKRTPRRRVEPLCRRRPCSTASWTGSNVGAVLIADERGGARRYQPPAARRTSKNRLPLRPADLLEGSSV
jgi:hypothetical protein